VRRQEPVMRRKCKSTEDIDPASIPNEVLTSEWARRHAAKRKTFGAGTGRPPKLQICAGCGHEFSATDLRKHKPRCPGR
jgi:hypothetical protein